MEINRVSGAPSISKVSTTKGSPLKPLFVHVKPIMQVGLRCYDDEAHSQAKSHDQQNR